MLYVSFSKLAMYLHCKLFANPFSWARKVACRKYIRERFKVDELVLLYNEKSNT